MPFKTQVIQRLLPRLLRLTEAVEHWANRWQIPVAPYSTTANNSASPSTELFISHGRGGGSEHYTRKCIDTCQREGRTALLLTFDLIRRCFVIGEKRFYSTRGLLHYLQTQHISRIHLHHLRYFPYVFVQHFSDFAAAIGAPYEVTLHDFMSFCPRIHLMDANWRYCGMPTDPEVCQRCISKNGILTSAPHSIAAWRSNWRTLLEKAAGVFAPSNDTAQRHQQYFKGIAINPWQEKELENLAQNAPDKPAARTASQPLHIILVGNIYELKGANIVLACARDARARALPISFSVIGNCTQRASLENIGVSVSGAYTQDKLAGLMQSSGAHAVFLASTWPETYSYVLSEVWQHGFFPIAFDLGAPAARIRSTGKGALIDPAFMNSPSAINDKLLEIAA